MVLAGCTGSGTNSAPQPPAAGGTSGSGSVASSSTAPATSRPTTSAPPVPARIHVVVSHPTDLDPVTPVSIIIAHGKLTKVTMTNPAGKKVTGAISSDGSSWRNSEVLGYARTYRIVADGVNAAGTPVKKTSKVTTLSPASRATPSINTLDDYYAVQKGATYGVAMVPDINFGAVVTNKRAIENAIKVITSPHVAGAFYWTTDSNDASEVHWRPEKYWTPGTTVTIKANVYGVKLAHGLYGGSDVSTSFKIGPDDRTVADDTATNESNPKTADHVYVYRNGKLLRTMLTSMGKHGGAESGGQWINFYTLNGDYTVLDHENPAHMSSASYGLSVADGGYKTILVPYSTKVSNDGIYLHEYNSTQWDQENGNDVSEGCLNLVTNDAAWYYNFTRVGDPVIVHGAKGAPTIQLNQGGDWSVPWSTWIKGNLNS
jgi:lipoprotein-anchoring transpeptidase ErfK/SrfK